MGGPDGFVKMAAKATGLESRLLIDKAELPEAIQLADKWKAWVEVAKIQGIPGYVVDGQYLILTKSIRGTDSFVDLVKELYEKTK